MSSGMSSDQIIKYEIMEKVKDFRANGIVCRIFPEGSDQDQKLISEGGLTFSVNGVNYGSCDAGWFYRKVENGKISYEPIIGLEGTDALNRGSSGDAQYQRFHHALGAVKNGNIGIYYLREGTSVLQPDLYEMAYNATIHEPGPGAYLIIQDLQIVNDILELVAKHGKQPQWRMLRLCNETARKLETRQFSQYNCDWATFIKSAQRLWDQLYRRIPARMSATLRTDHRSWAYCGQ